MTVMFSAVIVSAITIMMLMVITMCIRIIFQMALCQSLRCLIGIALNSGIQLDASICQSHLSAHPDASADQSIHLCRLQESCQCAMAAAVGINNLLMDNLSILCIIELELCRMAEMLEDFSVFISDCDSHCAASFL